MHTPGHMHPAVSEEPPPCKFSMYAITAEGGWVLHGESPLQSLAPLLPGNLFCYLGNHWLLCCCCLCNLFFCCCCWAITGSFAVATWAITGCFADAAAWAISFAAAWAITECCAAAAWARLNPASSSQTVLSQWSPMSAPGGDQRLCVPIQSHRVAEVACDEEGGWVGRQQGRRVGR